jgi:hypothetical protein
MGNLKESQQGLYQYVALIQFAQHNINRKLDLGFFGCGPCQPCDRNSVAIWTWIVLDVTLVYIATKMRSLP